MIREHECTFAETDRVYARNFERGETWLSGDIVQTLGPVSFQVQLVRRHQNQIRKRTDTAIPDTSVEGDDVFISPETIPVPVPPRTVPNSVSGTDQSSTDTT